MKSIIRYFALIVISISMMACTGDKLRQTVSPSLESKPQLSVSTDYPIGATSDIVLAYPIEGIPSTDVPAYLLPGFITATPDPILAQLVISEVRHENDTEIITIKNISDDVKDIGAFMIYSPELGERKILPEGLKLASGDTFIIYNGETFGYPEEQIWLSQGVHKSPLDEIWLLNDAARMIYYFVYYPSVSQ